MEESQNLETLEVRTQANQQDLSKTNNLIKSVTQNMSQPIFQSDEFQFQSLEGINPISLLKKPNYYKQAFQYTFKVAGQELDNQNYDVSLKFYQKALQLMEIGRNIINKENFSEIEYIKILIFANMSCGYLNIRKLQKCSKQCQKALQQIEKFLIEASKQCFLKISIIQMILKFQHCAILSQLQQHQRSLQLCKSNLNLIKKYLEILDIFVKQSLKNAYQRRKSNETVQFSKQVYKFAASVIKELLNYIDEPLLKKQEMVFYYWQKNPEKNQQQLIKRFIPLENQNCKRSILGVSKKTHWIDEFNIGSVMHMVPLNLKDLRTTFPVQEYLFKDKLYEITIYCSMCYFTMATQTRFIDSNIEALSQPNDTNTSNQLKSQKNVQQKIKEKLGNLNLMKKYGYSMKSQMFKKSQAYHLCSIDIMSRVVKYAIPYINHIVRSYQKHYIKEKKLEQIVAIFQQSYMQQDTIVNQSVAEYMPYQNNNQKSILRKNQGNQAFGSKKSCHILDAQVDVKGFDEIIKNTPEKDKKLIMKRGQNRLQNQQVIKLEVQAINQNSLSPQQISGEYLKSVVKKEKSLKSSKVRQQKQKGSSAHLSRSRQKAQETKELQKQKRKINGQKSPVHMPFNHPPKPLAKSKKK